MDSHPSFVPHKLFIVFQTTTDPDKGCKEKDTESKQEHARDNVTCPNVKCVVVITGDSTVNSFIRKPDQKVD
jgi:hypothetical protein